MSLPQLRIGIIDDEETIRRSLLRLFGTDEFDATAASGAAAGLAMAEAGGFDIFIVDLVMPDGNGIDVLRRLQKMCPDAAVIMMSAHADVAVAVEAMKAGAESFVTKPIDTRALGVLVHAVRKYLVAEREARYYRQHRPQRPRFIGISAHCREVARFIELMGQHGDTAVLLTGESGTGKGVVAAAIHAASARADRPFVEINCAELSLTLLESELFGHERGAFTDARERKPGLVEIARGGTLFLDEVAELDGTTQPKLLKFLESQTYRRVGGVTDQRADVRVIAATNADLEAQVEAGTFRRDLYFRLKVMPFVLTPLRERPEDIALLCEHFIAERRGARGRRVRSIHADALARLRSHPWPGNVRELRYVIERAAIIAAADEINVADLPQEIAGAQAARRENCLQTLEQMERELIAKTLTAVEGNRTHAARSLGVSRSTLLQKLKRYDLE